MRHPPGSVITQAVLDATIVSGDAQQFSVCCMPIIVVELMDLSIHCCELSSMDGCSQSVSDVALRFPGAH